MSAEVSSVLTRCRPSAFRALRKDFFSAKEPDAVLRQEFKRMVSGEESKHGTFTGCAEVKIRNRMIFNKTQTRTTASVTWNENGRRYVAYFVLEDEYPLPSSITDISDSLR